MASLIAIRQARTSFSKIRPLPLSHLIITSIPKNNNTQTRWTSAIPETKDVKNSVRNQTGVGLKITKQLFQTEGKGKNFVYSPLSIHVVLSLIAAGTKGPTEDELLSFLKSQSTAHLNSLASDLVPLVFTDGSPHGGPCLAFANGLWVEKSTPLKNSFKEVVDTFYKAARKEVDFKTKAEETRLEVNSWAEKETKGLIRDILPSGTVDSDTRLLLANALYFKGEWNEKFKAKRTKEHYFHLHGGKSSVKAPFMTSNEDQFVSAFDGFKVLNLKYKRGKSKERRFSMCLFLPDEKDGLPALVERVCSEPGFIDRYLPCTRVEVGDFRIPKFKITSGTFEVSKTLINLGLVSIFEIDPYKGGNLTEMVNSPPGEDPYVSRILHKAFIEVNEEGTEAAAVTVALISAGCARRNYSPPKPIDFVADHPFMFMIREEMTGAVLFTGQVLNPLE